MAVLTLSWAVILTAAASFAPGFASAFSTTHSTYRIPATVQNEPAYVRFEVDTPGGILGIQSRQSLDAPMLDSINSSVFDWWYFDAVSLDDPRESLVLTFFTATADAFPFLDSTQKSVLIAYAWASFSNGSSWAGYLPATLATVDIGGDGEADGNVSSGMWEDTGFRWNASKEDLSAYEISVDSPELDVKGTLSFTSRAPPHLPCGIKSDTTPLQIAPHIGWVNLVPDAVGSVDVTIRGTQLKFEGAAYHDKNWSDRNFTESVRSWYWGHGRLGAYSIVWFSYLAINDLTNTTYVSSYVARDGEILVDACDVSLLTVRPTGSPNTTGSRYPPYVGDIPDGFKLDFVLEENKRLRVNVSTESKVAGDGEYYMRWTGSITGEMVEEMGMDSSSKSLVRESSLTGVAVFEQFHMLERGSS
ncbi:Hydroxyneurosporene synthase [Penicillium cosmopolitanum]|uniref:Hydroxyneurosporene synthase n=1 Tax=Penicillium cosmopolitanum TaxID=1131564 RepID=A0A9W9W9U8_9EURO|nr:Hydroxyneurosporene synthase [Penicillium cosmopolitanum]KAJ5409116.1 Hydroxyneurosporene synthase [Penicillium cosmopolitanum]